MMRRRYQILFFLLFTFGCSSQVLDPDEVEYGHEIPDSLYSVRCYLQHYQDSVINSVSDASLIEDPLFYYNRGVINAVKKAYQLTDMRFVPQNTIYGNRRSYLPGNEYQGMIYSSVKETGTWVGRSVSLYTFFTALNNPRSKLYSVKLDEFPFHGTNCRSYYGTVCSGLVSYALGLSPSYGTYDFNVSDEMVDIQYTTPDSLQIADVLWRVGHVALITDIIKNIRTDRVSRVEICEATQDGCVKYYLSRESFAELIGETFKSVFRYQRMSDNVHYSPCREFIPVLDEEPLTPQYKGFICVDKGDRSCYLEGEDVVINVLSSYSRIDVYKDEHLLNTFDSSFGMDILLQNLAFGRYRAQVYTIDGNTDITEWIVVNHSVYTDANDNVVFFSSANAIPCNFSFRKITGSRTYPSTRLYNHNFTEDEIVAGKAIVPREKIMPECPFYMVSFSTEFGVVSLSPQPW